MQQGSGVDKLDDRGQQDRLLPLTGYRTGGQHGEQWTHTLATAADDIHAELVDQGHIGGQALHNQCVDRLHVGSGEGAKGVLIHDCQYCIQIVPDKSCRANGAGSAATKYLQIVP